MRNFSTFLLAVVLLTGITEFHQFLKVPVLLSHLQQHRRDDPALSLLDFLRIHYGNNRHPDDGDEQQDTGLPFRTAEPIQHTDIPLCSHKELTLDPPSFPVSPSIAYYPEIVPCNRSQNIFHPPPII